MHDGYLRHFGATQSDQKRPRYRGIALRHGDGGQAESG
jgi:hypothetical protein